MNMDKELVMGTVFLDLAKAFDTIEQWRPNPQVEALCCFT